MAKKITKDEVADKEKATETSKKSSSESTKISKEEATSSASTPKKVDIEALKEQIRAEVRGEMLSESGAVEIKFQKTVRPNSEKYAKKLNESDYVLAIWDTEDGEPQGYIEEVKINGAVAQIPKGVSVYVPKPVKALIEGYKKAEATTGDNIVNQQGTKGIKMNRDEDTKKALES
jgi:hypothetical protein